MRPLPQDAEELKASSAVGESFRIKVVQILKDGTASGQRRKVKASGRSI